MDVVVYRAKIKGEYIYNISLNPKIDYAYLSEKHKVREIEIITNTLPLYMGKFILRLIKRSIKSSKLIAPFKDMVITRALRNLNVERIKVKTSEKESIPLKNKVEAVFNTIGDRVLSIDALKDKIKNNIEYHDLLNIIQILYIENKIKITPIYGKKAKSEYCNICSESCEDCFLGFSNGEVLIYKNNTLSKTSNTHIRYRKARINDKLKNYVNEIADFINSRKDNLIVKCPPMLREAEFSYGIVFESLKIGGKVLFVTSPDEVEGVKIHLEEYLSGASIWAFDNCTNFSESDVLVCSYMNVPAFKEDFDLVILDDRLSFLQRPYKNIFCICKRALKERGKFVNISCTPLKDKEKVIRGSVEEIDIIPFNMKNPVPEPKFIISRYIDDSNVYLPDMSLDLLKWSLREGSGIVIFTPNNKISVYLKNYMKNVLEIKESIGISSDKSREDLFEFIKGNKKILITSSFKDVLEKVYNINIIVMYSDNEVYNEDLLLYICAMACNHNMNTLREVLFIGNEESENMLRAKSLVRSINKIAWENGYIKE